MATLSLIFDTGTIPLQTILDNLAAVFNYMPGTETQAAFCKRMVANMIIDKIQQQMTITAVKQINVEKINLT